MDILIFRYSGIEGSPANRSFKDEYPHRFGYKYEGIFPRKSIENGPEYHILL
jgi:hypothetical protein